MLHYRKFSSVLTHPTSVVYKPARGTPGLEGLSRQDLPIGLSLGWPRYLYSTFVLVSGQLGAKTHTNQRQDSGYSKNPQVHTSPHCHYHSKQQQIVYSKRLESARGTPGLEGLESARLVHNTTLDECVPKNVLEVLESLRDIVRKSSSAGVFLAGGPMWARYPKIFPQAVAIPTSPNTGEIRNYCKTRLDRDPEPEAMSNNLRAGIVGAILEKNIRSVRKTISHFHSINDIC